MLHLEVEMTERFAEVVESVNVMFLNLWFSFFTFTKTLFERY